MRPVLAALLALLVALAATGCTTAANDTADLTDAEQKVADVVDDLSTAAREDDPERVCEDLLAAATAKKLGGDCVTTFQQAFDDADALQFSVDSVRITGDNARVRVVSGSDDNQTDLVQLTREDDAWRITAVSPVETKKPDSED